MTAYAGRSLLLKSGTWAGGTIISQTRNHQATLDHEIVDITNKDSNGFRTILEGAGTKSLTITFDGVADNSASYEALYAAVGTIAPYALGGIADGDYIEGNFHVSNFQTGGAHNGEQTFSVTLNSSGAWTSTNV
ncbi:MAG: phage tail tube protein [Pseudomonadota bacterium]|jgi:predicted secreted protein